MKLFKRSQSDLPRRRQVERKPLADTEDTYAFRRGRTLTGSVSSLVYTASETQADLKSSRVHAHELRRKRRNITATLSVVLMIVAGFYFLVSQFTATATVVASPDPSIRLDSKYTDAIEDYLGDHFRQRLRIFMNAEQLSRYLNQVTPEVDTIELAGSDGIGRSTFLLRLRKPIASWNVGSKELYVDSSGVPFERNYFASPAIRIVDENRISSVETGQSITSNRFMSYIGQVIGRLENEGYTINRVVIPEGMTRQIEVYIEGLPYYFKLTSDRSAGQSAEDIIRADTWMKQRELSPEYVDVRVEGKAFYK